MNNAKSPTGTIHRIIERYTYKDSGEKTIVVACGFHYGTSFSFDREINAKHWPETNEKVTCGRCLDAMRREREREMEEKQLDLLGG